MQLQRVLVLLIEHRERHETQLGSWSGVQIMRGICWEVLQPGNRQHSGRRIRHAAKAVSGGVRYHVTAYGLRWIVVTAGLHANTQP